MLEINATGQPCKKFGLHPKLKFLQKLFNDEHALFVAGVGVLTEPVTKSDYMRKTKTQLFAHNTMQKEIGDMPDFGALANLHSSISNMGKMRKQNQMKSLADKLGVEIEAGDSALGADELTQTLIERAKAAGKSEEEINQAIAE